MKAELHFFRSFKFETQISKRIELFEVSVGVRGVLDPESGMLTNLSTFDAQAQMQLDSLQARDFKDAKELLQNLAVGLKKNIELHELRLQNLQDQKRWRWCTDQVSSLVPQSLRIQLAGKWRLLELYGETEFHPSNLQFLDWSQLLADFRNKSWKGEIFDPIEDSRIILNEH